MGSYNAAGATSTLIVDSNLDMGSYHVLSDIIAESGAAAGVTIDGVLIKDNKLRTIEGLDGAVIPKQASANLKNSYDGVLTEPSTGDAYVKQKTMTFTYGIKGTVRCALQMLSVGGTNLVYAHLYKNGVAVAAIGANTNSATYVARTADIDIGAVAAGETLELWVKAQAGGASITTKEWRLSYDNEGNACTVVNSAP